MTKQPLNWYRYEREVAYYFQYEPGPRTANLDPDRAWQGNDPVPPTFPPGADYWRMMTAVDRLHRADHYAPYRCDGNAELPSASMTLRAAYGTQVSRYDDSAPNGAKLLKRAQAAYARAAQEVPPRKRPDMKARLMARFDRAFGITE